MRLHGYPCMTMAWGWVISPIDGRRGQTYDHDLSKRTGTVNVRSQVLTRDPVDKDTDVEDTEYGDDRSRQSGQDTG